MLKDTRDDINFEDEDFQDLCEKFGFTVLDVLIYDPYIVPKATQPCTNDNLLVHNKEAA